ncbi:MAG: hypothetical protein Q8Q31_01010 [Nanoarchaeota archaeon]|nr:hypothetical protein [Nanoarchaeota archaeon]
MLNINELKKIHDQIEQDLLELEVIISEEDINYPNFTHTFKKVNELWDWHEGEEKFLFKKLKEKGYGIPYHPILFSCGKLKRYKKDLLEALGSGSEIKMKEALTSSGLKMIKNLREHMKLENEILYRLPKECFAD